MGRSEIIGAAWPSFIGYLATLPSPDAVMGALVDGPLATYRAQAGAVHRRDDTTLTLIGQHGYSAEAVARAESISLTVDMPATVAARRNELVIRSVREAIHEFSGMSLDPDIWGALADRTENGGFVVGPIGCGGRVVGTYNFTFSGPVDFDALDLAYFSALGALLGLWLTNPAAVERRSSRGDPNGATPSLTLSARQIRILQLAATGRSNPAIAANLGYSVSTVKQEMSRIMDILRADNRADAIHAARLLDLIGSDGEVTRTKR